MYSFSNPQPYVTTIFSLSLLYFHLSEILLVYAFTPEELAFSSALLSPPYLLAMSLSLVEHFVIQSFAPNFKAHLTALLHPIAILFLLGGEVLRKAAWLTARVSFTHLIKSHRRPQHKLISHGIYAYVRHPGYLGWFLWALGTQLLLANPLSLVAFFIVTWHFFHIRIPYEEELLVDIFGASYMQYKMCTPTWIPGIP